MKNIKLRIVYLILGSALLLFALFVLAVNVIIPSHFVTEAKKALLNEAEYQKQSEAPGTRQVRPCRAS